MALIDGLIFLLHANNNWNDSSGNGLDGTASGAIFETIAPVLGDASGKFDGFDDRVTTVDSALFDFQSNAFSILAWIKLTSLPAEGTAYRVIAAGSQLDGAGNSWAFGVQQNGGSIKLVFIRYNGSAYDTILSAPVTLAAGVKCKIVIKREGLFLKFFFNNVSAGDFSWTEAVNSGSTGLIIGSRYHLNSTSIVEYVPGLIDEVALWNRAITNSEIAELWNNGDGIEIGSEVLNSRRSRQMRSTFFR